jgi:hypothetical protein
MLQSQPDLGVGYHLYPDGRGMAVSVHGYGSVFAADHRMGDGIVSDPGAGATGVYYGLPPYPTGARRDLVSIRAKRFVSC